MRIHHNSKGRVAQQAKQALQYKHGKGSSFNCAAHHKSERGAKECCVWCSRIWERGRVVIVSMLKLGAEERRKRNYISSLCAVLNDLTR